MLPSDLELRVDNIRDWLDRDGGNVVEQNVQALCEEILDEGGVCRNLLGIHTQLVDNDLFDFGFSAVRHDTPLWWL